MKESDIFAVTTKTLSVPILAALLLCSVLLNIVLGKKVRDLNNGIDYLKAELRSAGSLNLGNKAPPIQAKDIEGRPATLTHQENGGPSILYIFTPSCSWCFRNLSNIKTLFTGTKANYRFVGISLSSDGLRQYVVQHGLDFPIYTDLTGESALLYKGGTPRTLVLSPDGTILKSWFGAYTGDLQREVEEYFETPLPGIPHNELKETENGKSACD
jgi:peroxiredoxin